MRNQKAIMEAFDKQRRINYAANVLSAKRAIYRNIMHAVSEEVKSEAKYVRYQEVPLGNFDEDGTLYADGWNGYTVGGYVRIDEFKITEFAQGLIGHQVVRGLNEGQVRRLTRQVIFQMRDSGEIKVIRDGRNAIRHISLIRQSAISTSKDSKNRPLRKSEFSVRDVYGWNEPKVAWHLFASPHNVLVFSRAHYNNQNH